MKTETIENPLIELLAIKLYEHDGVATGLKNESTVFGRLAAGERGIGWLRLDEEDRELYRRMARGEDPIGSDADRDD